VFDFTFKSVYQPLWGLGEHAMRTNAKLIFAMLAGCMIAFGGIEIGLGS
jgi:uncharacterized membrane protein